jgi:hypothetical protein
MMKADCKKVINRSVSPQVLHPISEVEVIVKGKCVLAGV